MQLRKGRWLIVDRKKILMVDDEPDILRVLDKRLTLEGFEIISTDDGLQAPSLAKSHQPDMIILDLQMPNIDGGELAYQLKADPSTEHIPILFLSSLISGEESHRMKHNCGGNPIVSKSIKIPALIAMINKLIYHPAEMS